MAAQSVIAPSLALVLSNERTELVTQARILLTRIDMVLALPGAVPLDGPMLEHVLAFVRAVGEHLEHERDYLARMPEVPTDGR